MRVVVNQLCASLNASLLRLLAIPDRGPEISDRIVAFDANTLERHPVSKRTAMNEFIALNSRRAAAIVEKMPADSDGTLDQESVDRLLVNVHCEMQRISEEFQHGRRVSELLTLILKTLRRSGAGSQIRVVDVGCGTGYVIRWLAANKALPDEVELIGADYHGALIEEAQRLADLEDLKCRFVVANAFNLAQPASVYISTGILHHFRGGDLINFFPQHNGPRTRAFLHFDFHPSALAPFGSWLFHVVRMREALARYDGVLSAVRAHSAEKLLSTARAGAPDFVSTVYGTTLWGLPIPRAFHSLVGILPEYHDAFITSLGKKSASLGVIK